MPEEYNTFCAEARPFEASQPRHQACRAGLEAFIGVQAFASHYALKLAPKLQY